MIDPEKEKREQVGIEQRRLWGPAVVDGDRQARFSRRCGLSWVKDMIWSMGQVAWPRAC